MNRMVMSTGHMKMFGRLVIAIGAVVNKIATSKTRRRSPGGAWR